MCTYIGTNVFIHYFAFKRGSQFDSYLQTKPYDMAKTPKAREWRKRNEGLKHLCTTKGAKEGKRQVRFAVAIAHSGGSVICEQVERGMNGTAYATFFDEHLDAALAKTLKPRSRRILQDNCPVQNSAAARRALQRNNVSSFQIPARSPDLNPIENLFNQIRRSKLCASKLLRRLRMNLHAGLKLHFRVGL